MDCLSYSQKLLSDCYVACLSLSENTIRLATIEEQRGQSVARFDARIRGAPTRTERSSVALDRPQEFRKPKSPIEWTHQNPKGMNLHHNQYHNHNTHVTLCIMHSNRN